MISHTSIHTTKSQLLRLSRTFIQSYKTMPSNTAAWLIAEKQKPLEIKSAPYTSPAENEIIVKNAAIAINPVDWKIQSLARFPLTYPAIIGEDVAGEVVEVGSSASSRFSKGTRVLGYANGLGSHKNSDSAFQEYTVIQANLASPIPPHISFEHAAVIPLGISTAAAGLFQKDHLALQHPSANPTKQATGKTLLIWGGSSSVGSNGIQLAHRAGYEVITTASPRNFDYVRQLGASHVFDYHSKTVVDELVDAFRDKTIAGALDTIGINGAFQSCVDVVERSRGDKFVSSVLEPPESLPERVKAGRIFAATIVGNEVGKAIFEDFLPEALSTNNYVAAPDPHVVGKGLESLQAGLDLQMKGVSAEKIVVTL